MAQESSAPISPQANPYSGLLYTSGKFGKAYFNSNKKACLHKRVALDNKTVLNEEDAESKLGYAFGSAFKSEAAANNWTLVDCLTFALAEIEAEQPETRPVVTVGRLTSILSNIAPEVSPEQLAEHFNEFVPLLPAAVKCLTEHLNTYGRSNGFILLRTKADTGANSTERNN